MTDNQRRTPTDHQSEPDHRKRTSRLDLSLSQVLSGAAAAATAAALGSHLGVAGTILGAAVASVIAAIAGSVYTASLRHTGSGVKKVLIRSAGHDTGQATLQPPIAVGGPHRTRTPKRLTGVLVVAGAAFTLAVLGITATEALLGHSLSGGGATTVQQVSHPAGNGQVDTTRTDRRQPTQTPSQDPSATAATPAGPAPTPTSADPTSASTTTAQPGDASPTTGTVPPAAPSQSTTTGAAGQSASPTAGDGSR
ncbi:hypothetical protein GCM10009841_15720 [Microlunatus panaciterrae]|uniref:Uncharacterized protein n=1 Tax=Microlunatus panaciterrae TaxID=400768 RepID=A0ABS2RMB2_9ACTN|nr:hypothetical protein [Microlunatus panaciterrae]MBM7800130.1 hypothetical protein [Microlunatus panaciterrae]